MSLLPLTQVGVALFPAKEAHSFVIIDVLRAIDDGNHFLLGTNGLTVLGPNATSGNAQKVLGCVRSTDGSLKQNDSDSQLQTARKPALLAEGDGFAVQQTQFCMKKNGLQSACGRKATRETLALPSSVVGPLLPFRIPRLPLCSPAQVSSVETGLGWTATESIG